MPMVIHPRRGIPGKQAGRDQPGADCPQWVELFFTATAILGALLLTPLMLYVCLFMGNALDKMTVGALLAGCLVVFWRQLLLKRWACVVACLAAWGVGLLVLGAILIAVVYQHALTPSILVFPLAILAIAPIMTAACIAGWRGLEPGF